MYAWVNRIGLNWKQGSNTELPAINFITQGLVSKLKVPLSLLVDMEVISIVSN